MARGFWSRLFGNSDPGDELNPDKPEPEAQTKPEPTAEATSPESISPEPQTPAEKPEPDHNDDHDGETRVSGSPKPSFTTDKASDVYAQALFELSTANGSLAEVTEELEQLAELLAGNADLANLLGSRALSRDDRAGVLARVFQGKVSDTLYKFLHVLNHKDRPAATPGDPCG